MRAVQARHGAPCYGAADEFLLSPAAQRRDDDAIRMMLRTRPRKTARKIVFMTRARADADARSVMQRRVRRRALMREARDVENLRTAVMQCGNAVLRTGITGCRFCVR